MYNNNVNSGEHVNVAGTVGCLPADQYLWQNFRLRRNVLSGKVEYRKINENDAAYRPLTDNALKSIILQSRRDGFVDTKDISADLRLLVDSEDILTYDPVREWLNTLQWDGRERLVDFWHRIPGITAEQIYWLNIWMRSVVAQWLGINKEHGNECVPTLVGTQGCGKSTFFVRMLPDNLRQYYNDNFRLGNQFDKDMALTNNLLVNLDEFDRYTTAQQAHIKHSLSRVQINSRKVFGRTLECRPRYASFTATTNNPQPLCDPTGSRRYICIRIPKGEFIDNQSPINHDQLFAQIVNEVLTQQQRYWFTNEEVANIQCHNAQFNATGSLEQMVKRCVTPINEENAEQFITITDIINCIRETYPATKDKKISRVHVGRTLHSMGIASKHTSHGELYRAVLVA